MAYPKGAQEKPKEIMTWAPMSLEMLCDPGATAAPINDTPIVETMMSLRFWNTSDIDDSRGASTACGSVSEFNTQVWVLVAFRLVPIYETWQD